MSRNKYRTNVAPFMNEVKTMARNGLTEQEIAQELKVSYSAFRKYKKDHPELAQALDAVRSPSDINIEPALRKKELERQKDELIATGARGFTARGKRADQSGVHRGQFEKNKKRIYQTQEVCGICGKPVDFSFKYPHPLSPCIDHIIPVSKGGHPSDIDNLQLAHWTCNRQKSDKLIERRDVGAGTDTISNRVLPHTFDWKNFRKERDSRRQEVSER